MGPGASATVPSQPAPALAWNWSSALLGALCSIPPTIAAVSDPSHGLALAVGVLPAVAVGVQGPRRGRRQIMVVGVAIGIGLTLGAALASHVVLAVSGIFVLCLGSAVLAGRSPVGWLVMVLAVPMVGAGLSFTDVASAASAMLLMVLGSAYGWLLSLAWPQRDAPAGAARELQPGTMLEYGVRLGLAGSICAGLGFALDLDHKGWATAACLLVMRPTPELTRLRGAGRAVAVTAGALAACLVATAEPSAAAIALAVFVALTGLAATRGSLWYVTGGFTTFIVILLLVYAAADEAPSRFVERVAETVLGVGVALIFGVAIPAVRPRMRRRGDPAGASVPLS